MEVIAIANRKGGVAKTLTTRSLATCLSRLGYRVLSVDADPQTDLTEQFGVPVRKLTEMKKLTFAELTNAELQNRINKVNGIDEVFEYDASEAILKLDENLSLLPTTEALTMTKERFVLVPPEDNKDVTRTILNSVEDQYDFVLIDCPPDLSSMTVNLLSSSDSVIIPAFPEQQSYSKIVSMLSTIANIKTTSNPNISVHGILFTDVDLRTNIARIYMEQIPERCPVYVYDRYIPHAVASKEAVANNVSVFDYKKDSRVALAYAKFTLEFLERNEEMCKKGLINAEIPKPKKVVKKK